MIMVIFMFIMIIIVLININYLVNGYFMHVIVHWCKHNIWLN
jgi:hypothetical protein